MKVAIFGCRDGEYLYEQIENSGSEKFEVVYFCDNDKSRHGTFIYSIEVINPNALEEKYRQGMVDAVIVAVRKGYSRYCIIKQLRDLGIVRIILIKPSPLTFRLPISFDEGDITYRFQWMHLDNIKKPLIHHLEAHAADGCNLNCRGCLHFANLYGRDEFPDLDQLLADIDVVAQNCEIFQFRVLGGEPLLNPRLPQFLRSLRKILPSSDIAVISNGILIPQMGKELFQVMREYNIGFNLTLYPPTLRIKEKIYETLKINRIGYGTHEERTDQFERFICLDGEDWGSNAYQKCVSRGILTLRDGSLYKCPLETYIGRYYERYGLMGSSVKGTDIRDFHGDWGNLIEHLTVEKGEFCKHCSEDAELFPWNNGTANKSDWLIKERKCGK